MARRKGTAWLVTWEWLGDHADPGDRIVAIFNYRYGGRRVRDLVEHLYASYKYDVNDKLGIARKKNTNPYRAQFARFGGIDWMGRVTCGHNPFLYARLVDGLRVDAHDGLRWKERPVPERLKALDTEGPIAHRRST